MEWCIQQWISSCWRSSTPSRKSFTDITLPDSAKLIDCIVEKKEKPTAEWIEIAPYDYYFLIEFDNDEAMES